MALADEIRRDIHGEPIYLTCDLKHETYVPVDPAGSILMDVIRVDNMPNFAQMSDPPDGWVTDVLRCGAHAVEEIPFPTDGYDEALVWVETVDDAPPGFRSAIDASDLDVVDHSPSSHGAEPPLVDGQSSARAAAQGDYGFPRIGRQRSLLPAYRYVEKDFLVEGIERQIAQARRVRDGEETT
ncbi:hypothetical protein SAMN05216559_2319 [Halomicrobium zhouii]|uniref:Uncharacterized protein n=1 Tax=Halomicrobium zhouii TaxID=767519 RepID=A0A1I6L9M5_9EURY|nr:hypothetical protein [Halomicrobium zhouii]SFS00159.1 hypothetical protein SAMN05216559_2319 [Halomicrobium zhouii]